jgi:uncharacterized membrane protein HdeD (DUF308 family)
MIGVNYSSSERWFGFGIYVLKFIVGLVGLIKGAIDYVKAYHEGQESPARNFVIVALLLIFGGVFTLWYYGCKDVYLAELSSPQFNETEKNQIRESYNSTLLWYIAVSLILSIISTIVASFKITMGTMILLLIGWLLTGVGIYFPGKELGWW